MMTPSEVQPLTHYHGSQPSTLTGHVLVLGMLTVDNVFECGRQRGLVRTIDRRIVCLGGKGYLVAAGLASVGRTVALVAEVAPSELPESVPSRVDLSLCPTVLDDFDRAWAVLHDGIDELTFVHLGKRVSPPPDYAAILSHALVGASATYVSACPIELLRALGDTTTLPELLVVNCCLPLVQLCGGPKSLSLAAVLDQADVVLMNDIELREMTGTTAHSSPDLEGSALAGHAVLVVTDGSHGCFVQERRAWRHFPPPVLRSEVKSTLGAGDALAAGFIDEYLSSGDLERACGAGMLLAREKVELFRSHL